MRPRSYGWNRAGRSNATRIGELRRWEKGACDGSTHGGGDGEEDCPGGAGVTGEDGPDVVDWGETESADDDASDSSADATSNSSASGACAT